MAYIKNLKIYAQAEQGKRLFSVSDRELPALRVGFFRRGYSVKTNRNGNVVNVMIDKRNG